MNEELCDSGSGVRHVDVTIANEQNWFLPKRGEKQALDGSTIRRWHREFQELSSRKALANGQVLPITEIPVSKPHRAISVRAYGGLIITANCSIPKSHSRDDFAQRPPLRHAMAAAPDDRSAGDARGYECFRARSSGQSELQRVSRTAYFALKRDAAGIDGETWKHYGEALEDNLRDLAARLTRVTSLLPGPLVDVVVPRNAGNPQYGTVRA